MRILGSNATGSGLKFLRKAAVIMLITCMAAAIAWAWWRGGAATGSPSIDPWLDWFSLALTLPGWFVVEAFDPREPQLATGLTDTLIPLLSGLIWGLLVLVVLKFSQMLRKYVRAHKSR
jgi:hypothetical protein